MYVIKKDKQYIEAGDTPDSWTKDIEYARTWDKSYEYMIHSIAKSHEAKVVKVKLVEEDNE